MGAAAGAEGPSRESQRVLGAPWPRRHQPLLGHQHPQGLCGRLWRQSVISAHWIIQTRQGNAYIFFTFMYCLNLFNPVLALWTDVDSCFVLCPGPVRHLSCPDRHHGGLQGGSAWVPRWPPVSVFLESLLPLRHRQVSTALVSPPHLVSVSFFTMVSLFMSVSLFSCLQREVLACWE